MSVLRPTFTYVATVERVVDGDTFDVDLDLGMRTHVRTRLRLEHVDAPEMKTPAGREAKALVEAKMPVGSVVTVATQKPDKYGRALASVQLPDGSDLATWLLKVAMASPYEGGARGVGNAPAATDAEA